MFVWVDLSIGSVLERLVLKNAAECTSQGLKWTSGPRVMIIFGRSVARSLDRSIAGSLARSIAGERRAPLLVQNGFERRYAGATRGSRGFLGGVRPRNIGGRHGKLGELTGGNWGNRRRPPAV